MKIERPPHVESRRAVAIVDAEGRKFLAVCVRCYQQKYILDGYTVCADCRPKRKSTLSLAIVPQSKRRRSQKPSAK